jgi:hypothetical protein
MEIMKMSIRQVNKTRTQNLKTKKRTERNAGVSEETEEGMR